MAQIFKPSANSIARASLVGFALLPVVVGLGAAKLSRSPMNTDVGVAKNQPVAFSHQHHVFELGIDCRYCHTSVEKSAFAGIPPTETCMSCHSQIWTNSPLLEPVRQSYEEQIPLEWNRINDIPAFVNFNHSIHIDRGIQCNTCHGAMQDMHMTEKGRAFQMAWCLDCHRNPERFIYVDEKNPDLSPRQQVFNLYWKYQADEKLTPRELQLIRGKEQFTNNPHEIMEGEQLVKDYGVKRPELADCSICHY